LLSVLVVLVLQHVVGANTSTSIFITITSLGGGSGGNAANAALAKRDTGGSGGGGGNNGGVKASWYSKSRFCRWHRLLVYEPMHRGGGGGGTLGGWCSRQFNAGNGGSRRSLKHYGFIGYLWWWRWWRTKYAQQVQAVHGGGGNGGQAVQAHVAGSANLGGNHYRWLRKCEWGLHNGTLRIYRRTKTSWCKVITGVDETYYTNRFRWHR
jgi:hypothetical protein